MTPPDAPTLHPKRCVLSCDSCGHAEKTNSQSYPFKCLITKPVPMMVHEYCVSWFGYVGCASHSGTPDADARQPRKCYDVNVCAFCTDVSCRCNGCMSPTKAQARVDAVIAMLQRWKDCQMVDLTDGGWYSEVGIEKLDEAIALLKDGVERK